MDEATAHNNDRNADDGSLEGPDIETPTGDGDGTLKPGGLGQDGTIPPTPQAWPPVTPASSRTSTPKRTRTPPRERLAARSVMRL